MKKASPIQKNKRQFCVLMLLLIFTSVSNTFSQVSCSTCANPSCPVESITETTVALGQNNISTALALADDQLGLNPLFPGESITVCVPVTVPVGSTVLGFKQRAASTPGGCGNPSEEIITYELLPASNCSATPITPNVLNASGVASGFNPEWNNLVPGNYILCYTLSVVNSALCFDVDLQGLGYYNVTASSSNSCSTCASPTCPVESIIEATVGAGQTNISTSLATAGDQLGLSPLFPGDNVTVCVPVTVPVGSTVLGFKQRASSLPGGCGVPSEEVISYNLVPASNCSATPINPSITNASGVASGFNPEWSNLTAGDYILCYTLSVTNSALCFEVDVQGLGYYNIIPPAPTCQDYQIQMYSDLGLNNPINTINFNCDDNVVYLGPDNFSPTFDAGIPYTAVNIAVTATSGNLFNLNVIRYDASTNGLAETLSLPLSGTTNNFLLRPAPGQHYVLDKSNGASGNYNYTITDVISGAILDSGIWVIVGGNPSAQSANILPSGSGVYSGTGVSNGLQPNLPTENYSNDQGLGFFDPAAAGPGTHTITYTWDNGLSGANNCSLVRTLDVTVTGITIPDISTTVPTCVADGSSSITNYDNTLTYTFTPSGPTAGVGGLISGMTLGTAYTVTAGDGACTSVASNSFTNLGMLASIPTPTITTVAPTCVADGSSSITNYDNLAVYTFTPVGPTAGVGGTISGMIQGTTYTVVANNGGCISSTSASFTNLTMLNTPSVPSILNNDPICTGGDAVFTITGTVGDIVAYSGVMGTPASPVTIGAGGDVVVTVSGVTVDQTIGLTSVSNASCSLVLTNTSTVTLGAGNTPTYTANVTSCDPGLIAISAILPVGTTFDWVSGPSGYSFPAGYETSLITNTYLAGLPAGSYCVDVTSPSSGGAPITNTLLTEDFESGATNWTIDNSGGNNQFIINNVYAGGTCTLGGFPFTVPNVPNQGAWATGGSQSNYLHIMATTTCGFACAEGGSFPPANANYCSTDSNQSITLNTPLNTVGSTNVTFDFYYLNNPTDSDDHGALEYSIDGGSTWTQSGANLFGQANWHNETISDPAWDNQPSLLFRITWTNDSGSSTDPPLALDQITITAQQPGSASCSVTVQECFVIESTPTVPTITTVAPTCLADGNSTVTNYNAALTYTFTPAGPIVGAGGAISGMTLVTTYTVTAGNADCTSVASAGFTNVAMLITPAVPTINTVAPTCAADGNSTVTNFNAGLTYTFTPVGPIVGAGGVITGMVLGTGYTVTAGNGSCTSVASTGFTNVAQLPGQPAPTINTVAPTCATDGNSTITNYNTGITYTFTPVGPTVGAGGVISGMTLGTPYAAIATIGVCVSPSSASFTNVAMLVTPAVPTINAVAPTCAADGNSTVTNYNGTLTYTFTPAGPTVGAGGAISGMTLGTAYTVTAGNATCTSVASVSFTNVAQLAVPEVPTINTVAPTCAADGNSTVTNYNAALTYNFTPAGPTVGAGGAISGMTLGTAYTVIADNGSCTSVASAGFTNLVMLVTSSVPTINTVASTCAADGNSTVTNYNAALTYTFTPAGPTVGAGGVINGMTLGIAYTVTAGNATCTSVASAGFTNVAMLVTPVADAPVAVTMCDSYTLPALTVGNYFTGTGGTGTALFAGDAITNTQTIYVYAESGTAPNCTNENSFIVTINNTPVAEAPVAVTMCDSYTLPLLTVGNYFTGPGGTGTALFAGDAITTTQTIYVYAETATVPNCTDENSFVVNINISPVPNAVADMEECDVDVNGEPDLDGLVVFDLASNTNAISNGLGNVSVSYYTALDGTGYPINLVADATAYTNDPLLGMPQPIYVLVVNNDTGCYGVSSFNLIVNTVSFTPSVDLYTCDDDNDTFGYFDLAAAELQMIGGALNLEVTFHETLAEAEAGLGVIPTNVLYQNVDTTNTPGLQELFLNITDLTTGCSYTAETIILNVIASPELPEGPLTYITCEDSGSADGFVIFDLVNYGQTVLLSDIDPSTVATDYTITYYTGLLSGVPDPAMIIVNPATYTNIGTPDQVIYASVVHTATGCEIIVEVMLHVDLLPVANYSPIFVCDDETADGFYSFNLLDYESVVTGGATDVSVDYFYTLADAESGTGTMISDYTNFPNTINPQVIYASVYNSTTECRAVAIVKLHVNPNPTPLNPLDIEDQLGDMMECDGDVDGSGDISEQIAEFDLTAWETLILTGNGPSIEEGVSASYYTSEDDAAAGINAIQNPATYNNISNPQRIYISVVNDGFGINPVTPGTGCNTITWFDIYVPVPEVNVSASKTVICVDANGVPLTDTTLPVLTASALPAAPYDYQWMLNGVTIPGATNQTFTVTEPGDYTVIVSGPTDFDCINTSAIQSITFSGSPDAYDASVTTTAFADSHQVVAVATSNIPGIEFWYSLDDGEPTTNGTFEGVSPGLHTVTISDGQGCWSDTQEVVLIDYPHFFTPNGDGINDTWKIIHQEGIPISQIYIFDRFGKLLKQLDPDSAGWDGTYNGNQMPATDYWFKIIYLEGADSSQKEFKAHFSLKR